MWGLDDYQCLPFMWGSSQLCNHASFTPNSIHREAVLREASPDYLYFAAISFIRQACSQACRSKGHGRSCATGIQNRQGSNDFRAAQRQHLSCCLDPVMVAACGVRGHASSACWHVIHARAAICRMSASTLSILH